MAITINGSGTIGGISTGGLNDNIITKNEMAAAGAWAPNGTVLQVVQGVLSTSMGSTSTSFIDTGLSASITPTSSSNKILIISTVNYNNSGNPSGGSLRILRNGSVAIDPSQYDGTGPYGLYCYNLYIPYVITYLDSPATTSAITYKVQMRTYNGSAGYVNGVTSAIIPGTSTLMLIEVAA